MTLNKDGYRLMLITHRTERLSEYEEARLAIEGGCRWVQLRMKNSLNLDYALRLAALCHENGALLCIDDDVEIALASGADGVHVGKKDMPVAEVWKRVREAGKNDFIVGATANTFEDIRQAAAAGASYIGLGPYRFTNTKEKLSPILGIDGYRSVMEQCRGAGISIPVYAIGGILSGDIPLLMQTGISGIAISGAIVRAGNPAEETRKIIEMIN